MANSFDVIVIGSGFGGAVTACRLAEKGKKVLILERGRRWDVNNFPRTPDDPWLYDANNPAKHNGWFDFRFFGPMTTVAGAGVGGGSLVYANVSLIPPPDRFKEWPQGVYEALIEQSHNGKSYYEIVGDMLKLEKIPEKQFTKRTNLVRKAADKTGYLDQWDLAPLAVSFDPDYDPEKLKKEGKDPYQPKYSKEFINRWGKKQGTCVHLANCDLGCDVNARNTLDLNYLALAEQKGAEIRPLHIISHIEPVDKHYCVHFSRIDTKKKKLYKGSETADKVILAAGTMGSTEVLLRSRDQYKTLPGISPVLGDNWSSNGDYLTFAKYPGKDPISATEGPTITCAIDFLTKSYKNQEFYIEDGGFPNFFGNLVKEDLKKTKNPVGRKILEELDKWLDDPESDLMPWFANGVDASNGRLLLKRPWWAFWRKKQLFLDWDVKKSEDLFNTIIDMHTKLTDATDGKVETNWVWKELKWLITPHPLGGCRMGDTIGEGVVNKFGQVFGYPNLYVACGSIIPHAVGLNPSRTIGATAEWIAANITD